MYYNANILFVYKTDFALFLPTVVQLGFSQMAYEVVEGGNVEICLSLQLEGDVLGTVELEKEIVASVESSDGTAICKYGEEFTYISHTHTESLQQ